MLTGSVLLTILFHLIFLHAKEACGKNGESRRIYLKDRHRNEQQSIAIAGAPLAGLCIAQRLLWITRAVTDR